MDRALVTAMWSMSSRKWAGTNRIRTGSESTEKRKELIIDSHQQVIKPGSNGGVSTHLVSTEIQNWVAMALLMAGHWASTSRGEHTHKE